MIVLTYTCPHCLGAEHLRKSCEFGCAFGFIREPVRPGTTPLGSDGLPIPPRLFQQLRRRRERVGQASTGL